MIKLGYKPNADCMVNNSQTVVVIEYFHIRLPLSYFFVLSLNVYFSCLQKFLSTLSFSSLL